MPRLLLLSLATVLAGCSLLGSNDDPPPELGRRDYVWSADTLYSPPDSWFYDLWGASSDNLWAVAAGGDSTLWHYDGQAWVPWPERVSPDLFTVFGFARDDVWMGGNDGKFFHFDGTEWSLAYR